MDTPTLSQQRNADLRDAYQRIIKTESVNSRYLKRSSIISLLMEMPAPRFYLTSEWARTIFRGWRRKSRHIRKDKIPKELVDDLRDTYTRVKEQYPGAPEVTLWQIVVEQPAKSFYISAKRMEEIIFNYSGR